MLTVEAARERIDWGKSADATEAQELTALALRFLRTYQALVRYAVALAGKPSPSLKAKHECTGSARAVLLSTLSA